jgi:hypothetical protein
MKNGILYKGGDAIFNKDLKDATGAQVGGTMNTLSTWRAEAVKNELIKHGVEGARLKHQGRGTDGGGKRTEILVTEIERIAPR